MVDRGSIALRAQRCTWCRARRWWCSSSRRTAAACAGAARWCAAPCSDASLTRPATW